MKNYEQKFYDACHKAASLGDLQARCLDGKDFDGFTSSDWMIILNTYIWHYNRAMRKEQHNG